MNRRLVELGQVIKTQVELVQCQLATPMAKVATTANKETESTPDTKGSDDESRAKDYYSLWQAEDAAAEEDTPPTFARRKTSMRQVVIGVAAAACLLVIVMFGTGTIEDMLTGFILINGPPGAQVWVEGTLIGETPLPKITAQIGEREVDVIHTDAGKILKTVVVDSESPSVLTLGPPEPAS